MSRIEQIICKIIALLVFFLTFLALPVLLKEYLVEAVLDGGKVEVGLREDDALGSGVDIEAVLAEHIVPHSLLKMMI